MMVLTDMKAAPSAGDRMTPIGVWIPAASGSATTL
jgi:hypothetical protein